MRVIVFPRCGPPPGNWFPSGRNFAYFGARPSATAPHSTWRPSEMAPPGSMGRPSATATQEWNADSQPGRQVLEIAGRLGKYLAQQEPDVLGVEDPCTGSRVTSSRAVVVLPAPKVPFSQT